MNHQLKPYTLSNNMKSKLIASLIFISLLFISSSVLASPGFDDDVDDVDTPIDGGASLLIGSGLVFGLKKLKNRKNSEE